MAQKICIDFETEAIAPRPEYPPTPVGVSIKRPDAMAKYYAWGHASENNCELGDAYDALRAVWDSDAELVFHNAQFDLAVAYEKLELPELPWHRVHDTMILAFLNNPHEMRLDLKSLADAHCGMPPAERDELRAWVLANVKGATKKEWGKHIAKAPGTLVAKYADGDTTRTLAIFERLMPRIESLGMQEAYDRERQLMPILMQNSREGIPVDLPLLKQDVAVYEEVLETVSTQIRNALGILDPAFNLDSDEQLAEVLDRKQLVKEWQYTEKGARSMSADALDKCLLDRKLFAMLQYRGALATCLNTFMKNWLVTAKKSKGKIFTSWNQTRGEGIGARTGRLSSTPNMQNIPTNLDGVNKNRPSWCPELPRVRKYIKAPKGWKLLGRDYASQEVRVFAHYEDAEVAERYKQDANADIHQFIADMVTAAGTPITRRHAKTILFLTFYGGGVANLAGQLGVPHNEAKALKDAFLTVFPALKAMNREMKQRAADNRPIKTLGGRLYHVEPPKVIDGRLRTFDYKLINVLIQGSSADMTKEAVLRWARERQKAKLLLLVHDEIVIMAPEKLVEYEMGVLKRAMESIELDVPVLSSGEIGDNWEEMVEYD